MRRISALKRAQILLQRITGRIRQSCILVPFVLANRLLLVRGGEIDWDIDRACERISWLAIMDSTRGKALLRFGHSSMLANREKKGQPVRRVCPLDLINP
jgi:hypothetical protein